MFTTSGINLQIIMNNLLKSKTRLTFIQIIFEHLSTKNDIFNIYESYILNYKSTFVDNFHNNEKIKFEFNSNFLKKLLFFHNEYTKNNDHFAIIDKFIDFKRSFKKWDFINQSIIIASLSELKNIDTSKVKIVLNDYLNIGKSFINDKEIKTINAIIDKIINEKI